MDKFTQILENVVRCKYVQAGVHNKRSPKNSYRDGLGFRGTYVLETIEGVPPNYWRLLFLLQLPSKPTWNLWASLHHYAYTKQCQNNAPLCEKFDSIGSQPTKYEHNCLLTQCFGIGGPLNSTGDCFTLILDGFFNRGITYNIYNVVDRVEAKK